MYKKYLSTYEHFLSTYEGKTIFLRTWTNIFRTSHIFPYETTTKEKNDVYFSYVEKARTNEKMILGLKKVRKGVDPMFPKNWVNHGLTNKIFTWPVTHHLGIQVELFISRLVLVDLLIL